MPDYGDYKVHPLADQFPLIENKEFTKLVRDIEKIGLRNSIVLSPDAKTIVDGRNRFLACIEARVDPHFRILGEHYTPEMIIDFIVSENLRRRDLTTGQKAFLGIAAEKAYAELREQLVHVQNDRFEEYGNDGLNSARPPQDGQFGRSAYKAAKDVGVSPDSIKKAKKLENEAPELAGKVRTGDWFAVKEGDNEWWTI